MTEVGRALAQIEAIHQQLAKSEVYRGWRSVPVAASGIIGAMAAAWQSTWVRPLEAVTFTTYWLSVAMVALGVGCAEIGWHYVVHATNTERRRSRRVLGQFLPALVAGAVVSLALVRVSPSLVSIVPGLWAVLFGVGVFAAQPYLPRASSVVAVYYWAVGLGLLWRSAAGIDTLSPWAIGATFGTGQIIAAVALYVSLERRSLSLTRNDEVYRDPEA